MAKIVQKKSKLEREQRFEEAAYRLCGTLRVLDEKPANGRPKADVADVTYCAILKMFYGVSFRRLCKLTDKAFEQKRIGIKPPYNTVQHHFNYDSTKENFLRILSYIQQTKEQNPTNKKRRHCSFNFANQSRFYCRNFTALMNELLCAKTCEAILRLIYFDQDKYLPERGTGYQVSDIDLFLLNLEKQVPKGLQHEIRNDVIQEITVAVLSGDIRIIDIGKKVEGYIKKMKRISALHWREYSLDAPVFKDSDSGFETYIDRLH